MPNEWQPYTGEYEKVKYDVKTRRGEIFRECWPNAGCFHWLLGVRFIKREDVEFIRESEVSDE